MMKKLRNSALGLGMVLGLLLLPSAQAEAAFEGTDLDGKWEFFALGYYEVFTTYCFGSLTIEGGEIVAGEGQYHSAPTRFRGSLGLSPGGQVVGNIAGTYDGGAYHYEFVSGQMNPRKDTIVGSGRNHSWWMCTFYLVKTN